MPRLIILRHGNTFDRGDIVTRVGGRTDLPLSTSGRVQADALAAHFRDTPFAAAFCSPLARTRATARTILSARNDAPALLIAPFLREIDYGPDENQPEDAVLARVGSEAIAAWDASATVPPGWLVDPDALRTGWSNLLVRARNLGADETALIVTSNGIARFLPDVVSDVPPILDRKLKTAAWGIVDVSGTQSRIAHWNVRAEPA